MTNGLVGRLSACASWHKRQCCAMRCDEKSGVTPWRRSQGFRQQVTMFLIKREGHRTQQQQMIHYDSVGSCAMPSMKIVMAMLSPPWRRPILMIPLISVRWILPRHFGTVIFASRIRHKARGMMVVYMHGRWSSKVTFVQLLWDLGTTCSICIYITCQVGQYTACYGIIQGSFTSNCRVVRDGIRKGRYKEKEMLWYIVYCNIILTTWHNNQPI